MARAARFSLPDPARLRTTGDRLRDAVASVLERRAARADRAGADPGERGWLPPVLRAPAPAAASRSGARPAPPRSARRASRMPGGHLPLRTRVLAIAIALVAILALTYWLGRDSSLVAVTDVQIAGATGSSAPAVESALRGAAGDMTTLHMDAGQLRAAVAAYPLVKDVKVETRFPHTVILTVVEHDPVGAIEVDDRRIAIAGDGTILRGVSAPAALPTIPLELPPGGDKLTDPAGRIAVRILAAAPRSLLSRVETVLTTKGGSTVVLSDGPKLRFGAPTRVRAKWMAAAAVLADPSSDGATYLDLRVPERPVAGGLEDPAAQRQAAQGDPSQADGDGTGPTTDSGTGGPTDPASDPTGADSANPAASGAAATDVNNDGDPTNDTPATDVNNDGDPTNDTPATDVDNDGDPTNDTPATDVNNDGDPTNDSPAGSP